MNVTEWKWNEGGSGWLAKPEAPVDPSVIVAGDRNSPHPGLIAAAVALLSRLPALKVQIADHLTGARVAISDGERTTFVVHVGRPDVVIVQVELRDTDRPDRAHVFVATGDPDPYYLYDLTVEGASIAGVEGRFW